MQWQMDMRTGSPSHAARSCPQLQDACRVVMKSSLPSLPEQLAFALVKDNRHDQILLVVEVAVE
jgi:hypothetical protein